MTTYEDSMLAIRFAALAPEPLAGDWDDVISRAGMAPASRQRPRGFPGRRRRFLVLAAIALVAAVGTAAAFGIRAFIIDRGFIGLPPEGATPSAPEEGELVLHWYGRSATHGGPLISPLVRVWVYADGRMIWDREGSIPEGANELTSGYLEQRLTSDGVELLRSEVVASGLFDRSLTLLLPQDYGSLWGSAEVRRGDRLVHLQWEQIVPWEVGPGSLTRRDEATTATPEQVSALRRVDALFTDPASVLPSSAWADRKIRAYVPSHYAVCIRTSPPKDASHLLSLLPTRAEELLRDKSRTRFDGDMVEARAGRIVVLGQRVTYCSKLTTEEAREVAEAHSGLDPEPGMNPYALAYRVAEGVNDWEWTAIQFEPYFPDGGFINSGVR